MLHPYSATFSSRHPDEVHRISGLSRRESHRRWWATLSRWQGPIPGEPRTIRDLVVRAPDVPIIVVGSDSYLDPLTADLRAALEVLASSELLVILSGGCRRLPGLVGNLVPFDARLNGLLRGPLMSLNARVARELLTQGISVSVDAVAAWLSTYEGRLPRFEYPIRERMTDNEVRSFISRELDDNPGARWSFLHRRLRDELQRACEQKRFRDLFFAVRAELGAQEGASL